MERIKSMLERVGEARLKRLAAATEPKAETTALTTEAEFEAVVASEGVKKAADRTRSHGTPPASISSYPTSSITTPSAGFSPFPFALVLVCPDTLLAHNVMADPTALRWLSI